MNFKGGGVASPQASWIMILDVRMARDGLIIKQAKLCASQSFPKPLLTTCSAGPGRRTDGRAEGRTEGGQADRRAEGAAKLKKCV